MNLVVISVYVVLALMGLGFLAMVVFGIRSVAHGKINPLAVVIMCIPLLILVVLGFVLGDWSRAGIMTILITLGLAVLSLLVTGIKGLFI